MSHTDLTEERIVSLAFASGMCTLGKADKLRAFCDAALCEIAFGPFGRRTPFREICVR